METGTNPVKSFSVTTYLPLPNGARVPEERTKQNVPAAETEAYFARVSRGSPRAVINHEAIWVKGEWFFIFFLVVQNVPVT